MPSLDDKQSFSLRLKQALKRSSKKVDTAAELALQFNLRHLADPITVQAAQKWLTGRARPTVDKTETLAQWLNVSSQWLRFGIPEQRGEITHVAKSIPVTATSIPSEKEQNLLASLRAMPEHRRNLVYELVEQLSLEQAIWRD